MKINFKFSLLFSLFCLIFSSACQKEKLLNDEADVLAFSFDPTSVLASKATINNKNITVQVKEGTDLSQLKPVFTLSAGASITPAITGALDFTQKQEFTVISENGLTKNNYAVHVTYPLEVSLYSFENWEANLTHPFGATLKGEQPVLKNDNNESVEFWASSNFGYGFLNDEDEKEAYPVKEIAGVSGKGVSISTKEGRAAFKAPIIAGSLFSGSFDVTTMIGTPMKATHFGQPITKEVVTVRGYYAYKAGPKFTDKDSKTIEGRKDQGIISAVFYEIDDDFTSLDGTNLYTDKHIISKGELLTSDTEGDGFHEFSFDLKYIDESKKLDLKNKKYKFALVFSSSADGGTFLGAIGSELKIDEVEILTK